MHLSESLLESVRGLAGGTLQRLKFYRLVPIHPEDVFLAAVEDHYAQGRKHEAAMIEKFAAIEAAAEEAGVELGDELVGEESSRSEMSREQALQKAARCHECHLTLRPCPKHAREEQI
jgi:hypothetical protein